LRTLCPSLVFRGTTPEVMAEDLERFLEDHQRDPDGYARLRAACREHVERYYAWERATDELDGTLRHLASAGGEVRTSKTPATLSGGDPASSCGACGSVTRRSALVYRGVRYRRCPSCRSLLSTELPTESKLRHTYETEYPLLFAPEQVTSERTRLFGALLDRLAALGREQSKRPRLIDVGSGGGHLAGLAHGRRWLAIRTELEHPARARAPGVAGAGGGGGEGRPPGPGAPPCRSGGGWPTW